MSKPVFIQLNEFDPKPVRSTGNFGAIGKQSSASTPEEAINKASTSRDIPDGYDQYGVSLNNGPIGWVVKYRRNDVLGGKSRKGRRGKKSKRKRSSKTRRRRRK
jgi:hypothetical protein